MYLDRETESRYQDSLIFFEIVRMNVTLDVGGNGVLRPAPVRQGARKKLQSATRRGKTSFEFTIDNNTGEAAPVVIWCDCRHRNYIRRGRFWRLCINAIECVP